MRVRWSSALLLIGFISACGTIGADEHAPTTYACVETHLQSSVCSGSSDAQASRTCRDVSSPDACVAHDGSHEYIGGCGITDLYEIVEIKDVPCAELPTISGGWRLPMRSRDHSVPWFDEVVTVSAGPEGYLELSGVDVQPQVDTGNATLHAVWGSSSDAIVVGGDGIVIMGSAKDPLGWKRFQMGGDVNSIWGSSVSDIWIVGTKGLLAHWNGSVWEQHHEFDGTLHGGWVAPDGQMWAAGDGGTLLHFDGQTFSKIELGTSYNLYAVSGTSSSDFWVAGDAGFVLHSDGANFSTFDGRPANYRAIAALGSDEVHFASDFGMDRWNGFELRHRGSGNYNSVFGRYIGNKRKIFAGGEDLSAWVEDANGR